MSLRGPERAVDRRPPVEVAAHYPNADQITLRQLLSHTSGVFDFYYSSYNRLVFGDPLRVWTPQEVSTRSCSTRTARPAPATATPTPVCPAGPGHRDTDRSAARRGTAPALVGPVGLTNTYFEDGGSPLPSDAGTATCSVWAARARLTTAPTTGQPPPPPRSRGRAAQSNRRRLTWRRGRMTSTAAMFCRPSRWRR